MSKEHWSNIDRKKRKI